MKPSKPFRGTNNAWLTKSLFYERAIYTMKEHRTHDPVFSLYDDLPDLINARKTFVALGDPTGYKWAIEYLGDHEHWLRLMKSSWFREAFDIWLHELKTKMQSEAIEKLKLIADGDSAQSIAANKFIATFDWERSKKGRPSKVERDAELRRITSQLTEEDEDAERIGLTVIQGGKIG